MALRFATPAVAAVVAVLSFASAHAEDVSIMIGGIEKQIYLPAVLAEKLGYFDAEGLNVSLLSEPAGVEAADEMLAGAVQGVIGFYDHNIDLQALGKYTESVVQLSRVPGEVELVSTRAPGNPLGRRFQGQAHRRDRPRLVDRLPDPVPAAQGGGEIQRGDAGSGRRRRHADCGHAA